MSNSPKKPSGRKPDDPSGSRVSMHIRMRPSVKAKLKELSESTGRPMIDILEQSIQVEEAQAEFKTGRDNRLLFPEKEELRLLETSGISLKKKKTTRVNGGVATNDLVLSCYQEGNDTVFPQILKLYVPEFSVIADTTFGKGVFWKNVDTKKYDCRFSDLKTEGLPEDVRPGIDARRLPYENASMEAVVFDPPYMHTPGGTAHNGHQNFEQYYANNVEIDKGVARQIWEETNGNPPKYHEAVTDLYFRSGREAWRVLKENGIYIVKCQDEVCSNRNRFTHVEIMNELADYGFMCKDLFVVMRTNRPGVSCLKNAQAHARKNHSYFLVFQKPEPKKRGGYRSCRNSRKN